MNYSFRQYTGLARTPSSLTWLLATYMRTLGLLEKKKKRKAKLSDEIAALSDDISGLQNQLQAIERVIGQHEIQVEPNVMPGKRPKREKIAAYGQMSRSIFEQLRAAKGEPRTTTELAIGFLSSISTEPTMSLLREARIRVRRRLTGMVRSGDVTNLRARPDEQGIYAEGMWVMNTMEE